MTGTIVTRPEKLISGRFHPIAVAIAVAENSVADARLFGAFWPALAVEQDGATRPPAPK